MTQLNLLPFALEPETLEPETLAPELLPPESGGLKKAAGAYKTISEVAEELGVPQHVLRFWENHFPQVKPSRMRGARRYYRPEDVDMLKKIKTLLYHQGYTIKGAKKLVKGRGKMIVEELHELSQAARHHTKPAAKPAFPVAPQRATQMLAELKGLRTLMQNMLAEL